MYIKVGIFLCFLAVFLYFFNLQVQSPIDTVNSQNQKVLQNDLQTQSQFYFENPSLDSIFSKDHSWVATLSAEKKRILIATGDVLLARSVNFKTVQSKNFNWPFEKTADVLKSADITFINLETPLVTGCFPTNEGMSFCGDPQNVEGLLFAGVDVVNIANNHAGNYDLVGVQDTIHFLTDAGLLVAGVSGPIYKDIQGILFGFLGYNEVDHQESISLANQETIVREVALAKSKADIVVVQFHWGNEYTTTISSNQKTLGHLAIDSGADLIIGNHAHWIQPIEIYKNKIIMYAHGNFIFDQEWSLKTKQGVVGKYTFYDKKLIDVEFLPVQIQNYGQPYFLTGEKKESVLQDMKKESELLSSPL